MGGIDEAAFQLDERFGIVTGLMIAVMMFAVALDLRWQQFERVLENPKAPLVGLIGQLVALPALAFGLTRAFVETPSVALGLLLVASCPAGGLSNYLTDVVKGSVATSVSMTAVGTIASTVTTPVVFAFWASLNPDTLALLRAIDVDLKKVALMFLVALFVPIVVGMLLAARRPMTARRIRPWARRISGVLFAVVVATALTSFLGLVVEYARLAAMPAFLCVTAAVLVSWVLARTAGLPRGDRRAVVLEIGAQNVALGLGMAVTFFASAAGVAVAVVAWGVAQIVVYLTLVTVWLLPWRPGAVGAT